MSTVSTTPAAEVSPVPRKATAINVYSHSTLLYWWPVWTLGALLAILTYVEGIKIPFADAEVVIHPSKNLGVIYTIALLLVIVLTNATVRGLASAMVIVILIALTFMFAYMGWWESILSAVADLAMFMNLGFYVFFSTAVFIIWLLTVFVFDRLEYWTFRPGQVVHNMVFGGGARTYDTNNMSVYKLRSDLFRHWILGLGSGDLHVATTGANAQEFILPNVMFIGVKLPRIQELVAMKPDENTLVTPVTFGEPG
jgi:hypothetical protein